MVPVVGGLIDWTVRDLGRIRTDLTKEIESLSFKVDELARTVEKRMG